MSKRILASGLLASLLLGAFGVDLSIADDRDSSAPRLGLSTGLELGQPGVPYDVPLVGPRPARVDWGLRYGPYRRYRATPGLPYGYGFGYGYDWAPWYRIAPSERFKANPTFRHGALGVRYGIGAIGTGTDIGLELPGDPEDAAAEDIAAPAAGDPLAAYPLVAEALALMKRSEYAKAGRLLATQLKAPPAPLDVYIVISELLVATGKLDAAGKIFRYGIEGADSLDILSGVNIANHFPSPDVFKAKMKALAERAASTGMTADIELLAAAFRVLSGDAAGMKALQEMRDDAATRLYLHFADMLFEGDETKEAPANEPKDSPANPEEDSAG